MMLGRIATDGRLSGRLKYDVLDWLAVKLHMQLSNEAGQSQARAGKGGKVQSQATRGEFGGNMAWQSPAGTGGRGETRIRRGGGGEENFANRGQAG